MDNELNLDEASEQILALSTPEEPEAPEPEIQVSAEPDIQPEPDYLQEAQGQQAQLAAYQNELSNEAAAIRELERDARSFRKDNPGEYAARMADAQVRANNLTKVAQQFQAHVNNLDSYVSQRANTDHQRKLAQAESKLQSEIPGWDQAKKIELANYLQTKGYTSHQIASVSDARTIKMAWDSMQTEKSRTKTLPKKVKPVDRRAHAESEITRQNLGRSSTQAAAARIEALMFK